MIIVATFSDFSFHFRIFHNLDLKVNSMGSFPFSCGGITPDFFFTLCFMKFMFLNSMFMNIMFIKKYIAQTFKYTFLYDDHTEILVILHINSRTVLPFSSPSKQMIVIYHGSILVADILPEDYRVQSFQQIVESYPQAAACVSTSQGLCYHTRSEFLCIM